ncbi:MAG: isochorismatase family protein [Ruminiclostridium sp.]|nr:isochorismatase family protein [Ruminiclostridium sp.]
MVLLVVDTQKAIVNNKLYNFDLFVSHVKEMIDTARQNNIEVIYVRHDDGTGSELTKGNDGFEIYDGFKPADNEIIFNKSVNSAFRDTGLLEHLKRKNENTIIIVGLQTGYCIDANIKAGFEHGFGMIVSENTNSTFDNRFMSAEKTYKYYNEFIWNGGYAKYVSFDEAIGSTAHKRS